MEEEGVRGQGSRVEEEICSKCIIYCHENTYVAVCRKERKVSLAHSPGGSGPMDLASAQLWGGLCFR